MAEFITRNEYVQISADFIKNELKEANGEYVKVYLYILALAATGEQMTTAELARELNLIESDILNAFSYWRQKGALKEDGERIYIGKDTTPIPSAPVAPKEEKKVYDSIQVSEKISTTRELSDMMHLAQDIFGRILTQSEMESIYWFYDGLNFSPEAILLLLEFCVSKGKTSMKYIEKVALSWNEKGAHEADTIMQLIRQEEQKNNFLYSMRKALGIADRALSQNEEQFLLKWKNEKGMSEEMIALAYEYCIIQTAKLSFPYMDRIIERWFTQGIKTIDEAEADNKNFKQKKNTDSGKRPEYTDLENLTRGRIE